MTAAPLPTWEIPAEPGWVGHLRGVLRRRDAEAAVAAEPIPDPVIEVARATAVEWLCMRGADAARQIVLQFSNVNDLRCTWSRSSGIDAAPALDIAVWHGQDAIFRYTLAIVTDEGGVRPRVTVRANDGPPQTRAFGPWLQGATHLPDVTVDEIAEDIASAFSEAMTT